MPCDIGTRAGGTFCDVGNGSAWKEGLDWMKRDASVFPVKDLAEIKLEAVEKAAYEKEIAAETKLYPMSQRNSGQEVSVQIQKRLVFSKYIIDPNRFRFKCTVRIIAIVFRFLLKVSKNLKRKFFLNHENDKYKFKHFYTQFTEKCVRFDVECMSRILQLRLKNNGNNFAMTTESTPVVILTKLEIDNALYYLYKKASREIEEFGRHTKAYKNSTLIDGVRYWNGRLLPSKKFTSPETHPMSAVMSDLSSTVFCVPVVDQYSPIAWSIVYEIHWFHPLGKHSGVATTSRMVKEYAYISRVKEISELFRKLCGKCRYMAKRTIDVEFGPLSDSQMIVAPAFYVTQVDLMGPYRAYQINVRATMKIWFAVFVCVVTSTVNIQVMEFYSTGSFISAFIRLASQNGYPKVLLPDQGKNVESGARNVEIDWVDIKGKFHRSCGLEVDTCGVGGHHQHGKVERKIRQIKESFEKSFHNVRLSVLQWQTVADETANSINNMPIGTGSSRNVNLELDDLDIITPNRLKFGRNNERSPLGPAYVSNDPFKFIDMNQDIFESWWEHWLVSAVPELIEKPVNWKGDENIKDGDIVLFRKVEGTIGSGAYQYGIVMEAYPSDDGTVRTVRVRYRNHDESQDRSTKRAVKSLILIHRVNELDIMRVMADASDYVDNLFKADVKSDNSGK